MKQVSFENGGNPFVPRAVTCQCLAQFQHAFVRWSTAWLQDNSGFVDQRFSARHARRLPKSVSILVCCHWQRESRDAASAQHPVEWMTSVGADWPQWQTLHSRMPRVKSSWTASSYSIEYVVKMASYDDHDELQYNAMVKQITHSGEWQETVIPVIFYFKICFTCQKRWQHIFCNSAATKFCGNVI